MPHLYMEENNQCTAFGKRDKRRCRLERRPGKLTCEVHKRYYETWLDTHRLFDLYHIGIRERRELEFQIERKYVTIPHEWIAQLRTPGERAWYPFLLKHCDFSPVLNISCFRQTMFQEFFYNVSWPEKDSMQVYVRDVESCNEALSLILQYSMSMSHGGFFSFLDLVGFHLRRLDWWPILFSTSYIKICETLNTEMNQIFSTTFTTDDDSHPLLVLFKKFHKRLGEKLRKRCEVYKEELMMAAWAPKRIQRWLDMGCELDILDSL